MFGARFIFEKPNTSLVLYSDGTCLAQRCASAEDAAYMARSLDLLMTSSSSQAVCCQLAASTSFRAFEILCAKCEGRGLVFVHADDPEQKLGEVYYDRDPSWQHEMVSGLLSKIVAVDLNQLAGRIPPYKLAGCLLQT